MKKILTILFVAAAGTIYQCSPASEQNGPEARAEISRGISKEKQTVVKDLRWLRDDINDRLDEISIKLETAPDESRDGLEEARLKLIDQLAKVDKSLNEVSQSKETSWDNIQRNARNTSDEVKAEFEKLSGRISFTEFTE